MDFCSSKLKKKTPTSFGDFIILLLFKSSSGNTSFLDADQDFSRLGIIKKYIFKFW